MLYAHTCTEHKEIFLAQMMTRLYTVMEAASSSPVILFFIFMYLFFYIHLCIYIIVCKYFINNYKTFRLLNIASMTANSPYPVEFGGIRWHLTYVFSCSLMSNLKAYTSYSRSRNSPACSLHIYWYSVCLSSLHPFNKIRIIFQHSSAYSTHQAQQNKHF